MGPTVRIERMGKERWRVSVVRGRRRSSVAEGSHDRVTRVAWRAVSLLNLWDSMLPDGRLIAKGRRYLIVERAARLGVSPNVIASFATFELAETFLADELEHGHFDAAIYDRNTHELILDQRPDRVPLDWLAAWRRGHSVRGARPARSVRAAQGT